MSVNLPIYEDKMSSIRYCIFLVKNYFETRKRIKNMKKGDPFIYH